MNILRLDKWVQIFVCWQLSYLYMHGIFSHESKPQTETFIYFHISKWRIRFFITTKILSRACKGLGGVTSISSHNFEARELIFGTQTLHLKLFLRGYELQGPQGCTQNNGMV